jgi:hypothetical protein
MPKKITLPSYERMIMEIGGMSIAQLTVLIDCAKVALARLQPKTARKKRTVGQIQEKAS